MVEVFKTDVANSDDARKLIQQIHQKFTNYKANFDLEDCDLILRVEVENDIINAEYIIFLLKQNGFFAEILLDDFEPIIPVFSRA